MWIRLSETKQAGNKQHVIMPRKRKDEIESDLDEAKLNKPHQRFAANARERSRMRVLSKAFSRLKTTLPWVPPDTKLSKLDTLRLASSYIAHLKQILEHEETIHAQGTFIHPLNLTWPFTFSSRTFGSSPLSSPRSSGTSNNRSNSSSSNNSNNNSSNHINNNNNSNNNTDSHKTSNGLPMANGGSTYPSTILAGVDSTSGQSAIQGHHRRAMGSFCDGDLSPISDSSSNNECEFGPRK